MAGVMLAAVGFGVILAAEPKSHLALRAASIMLAFIPACIAVLLLTGAARSRRTKSRSPAAWSAAFSAVLLLGWLVLLPSYRAWLREIAEVRRLPEDQARWKDLPDGARRSLAQRLRQTGGLTGLSRQEVISKLGPPDSNELSYALSPGAERARGGFQWHIQFPRGSIYCVISQPRQEQEQVFEPESWSRLSRAERLPMLRWIARQNVEALSSTASQLSTRAETDQQAPWLVAGKSCEQITQFLGTPDQEWLSYEYDQGRLDILLIDGRVRLAEGEDYGP